MGVWGAQVLLHIVDKVGSSDEQIESRNLPGPAVSRPWSYGYLGTAVRPEDA